MNLEEIAAAGLELVDSQGADALTMRAVADALGVSTMGLYHYVANKSALIELLIERAHSERPIPAPRNNDWRDDLVALATWIRDTTRAHPAIQGLSADDHQWTPSMLVLGEHWMSVWHRSGLDFDCASRAASASATAIIGFVKQEMALGNCRTPDEAMLSWTPNMRAAKHFRDQSNDFELVVRSLADGLCQALSRGTGAT